MFGHVVRDRERFNKRCRSEAVREAHLGVFRLLPGVIEKMPDPTRRERINEIYRSIWNPERRPGEGLPLTPDDHILAARRWIVEFGEAVEEFPFFKLVAKYRGEEIATEYVWLLLAEATGADGES